MNRQPFFNQALLRPFVYASTALLLVGGIIAIRHFFGSHPYFSFIIAGFVVLSMFFLGMKLFLLKTILGSSIRTPEKRTGENE